MHPAGEADSIPSTETAAVMSAPDPPQDSAKTLPPTPPRWTLLTPSPDAVATLCAELGISPLLATMLVNRRQDTPDAARRFLHPSLDDLHDPFLMHGMDTAVTRLLAAVDRGETVLVYGDYDVDGATAVIVLRKAIERLGGRTEFHIPHRIAEGYGMREDVLDRAAERGIRLVVSVDTGIRASAVVEHASSLGMECIITDHHLPETEIPAALAVLNPKQPLCPYPDKELCGVGVVFKLVDALFRRAADRGSAGDRAKLLESFLKVVAIGTIADVVPLTGENRVIARFGLAGLRRPAHAGLKALISVAGLNGKSIGSGDVGFRLAPRLNAAGRMDTANDVIQLFENADDQVAAEVADRLNKLNIERQESQERVLAAVERQLAAEPELLNEPAWVFAGEGWHRGVVGIVAGRLLEKYHRPVIVLSLDDDGAHGSGRSISKFHLLDALDAIQRDTSVFRRYGGHSVAIGASLDAVRVPELRRALAECAAKILTPADLIPELRLDAAVRLPDLNDALLHDLESLAPHGMANPSPLLGARDLELVSARVFGGKMVDGKKQASKHLSLRVRQDNVIVEAVFWGRADLAPSLLPSTPIALAFHPERDEFQGESRLRLLVKDLRIQSKFRS
jgi:single-stranded-DNA-specific exonuclease